MVSRQVLNVSRDTDPTASLGSLFQGSAPLNVQKFPLVFRQNFLCFSLCPLACVLSLGTTGKSLALSSWHPPFRYFYTLIRSPFGHLKDKQAQLPQPFPWEMLQSPNHLHSPPLHPPQQFLVFLELLSPELSTTLQVWPHQSRGSASEHKTSGVFKPVRVATLQSKLNLQGSALPRSRVKYFLCFSVVLCSVPLGLRSVVTLFASTCFWYPETISSRKVIFCY